MGVGPTALTAFAGGQEGSTKIHAEHAVHRRSGHQERMIHRRDTGIVDEHIEPAVSSSYVLQQGFDLLLEADIRLAMLVAGQVKVGGLPAAPDH